MRRSLTSAANSGDKEDMMWSNLERWDVILLQANCASTWANQTSGSAGQNGGSLRLTADTSAEAEADPEGGGGSEVPPEVDDPEAVRPPSIVQEVLCSVGVTNVA